MSEGKQESAGVPAWVMTFADLMTLLMCFFVLLLAFSEMDVSKFKQLSGSMKEAFGVQSDIQVKTIPKGTSVVAQEFSPGKPEPTAINTVRQFTIDSNRNTLDALSRELKEIKETREHARRLRLALKEEIEKDETILLLEDYFSDRSPSGVKWEDAASMNSPFRHNNKTYINMNNFRSYLSLVADYRIKPRELSHKLKQAGFSPEKVQCKNSQGEQVNKRYWSKEDRVKAPDSAKELIDAG